MADPESRCLQRPTATVASDEGTDLDAAPEPTRYGRRGTDALARRSDRCLSRARQPVRQRRRVQAVQPRVRQLARRHAAARPRRAAGVRRLGADDPLPPQPGRATRRRTRPPPSRVGRRCSTLSQPAAASATRSPCGTAGRIRSNLGELHARCPTSATSTPRSGCSGSRMRASSHSPPWATRCADSGSSTPAPTAILELPLLILLGTPAQMHGRARPRRVPARLPDRLWRRSWASRSRPPRPRSLDPAALARRDLLLARADAGDCDLVVHATRAPGGPSGALYLGGGQFAPRPGGRAASRNRPTLWAEAGAPGSAQVWTCVPAGIGRSHRHRSRRRWRSPTAMSDAAGASPVDPVSRPGAGRRRHPDRHLGAAHARRRSERRRRFRVHGAAALRRAIVVPPCRSRRRPDAHGRDAPGVRRRRERGAADGGAARATPWRAGLAPGSGTVIAADRRLGRRGSGPGRLASHRRRRPRSPTRSTSRRSAASSSASPSAPAADWCAEAVADGTMRA